MSSQKALCVTMLVIATLWLASCADGYPTEEGTLVLTYGMSEKATLKAMNTIGHHGYLEHRWRYELGEACRLRVRSRGIEGGELTLSALAPGLQARVVAAVGERSHMVFAKPADSATMRGALVLGGANEFDAGQMKWLVEYLGSICRPVTAPTG